MTARRSRAKHGIRVVLELVEWQRLTMGNLQMSISDMYNVI